MTLKESIEYMEQGIRHQGHRQIIIPVEAAQLGVEALKAYQQARQEGQLSPDELLPSETKE
jgi:hypothetical protein